MSAATSTLPALRRLLSERFPQAARASAGTLPTGIPHLDATAGGLPCHALTELVCAAPSCGAQLFVGQLLATTRAQRIRVALIDAHDCFDPTSYPADDLAHLLWIRCEKVEPALQATDLLVRDANLGLVILDLRYTSENELRRIPNRQWYLFQRAVESTDLALLIVTPRALVSSAQLRLELSRSQGLSVLENERPRLAVTLAPVIQRQRLSTSSSTLNAVA